MAGKAQERLLLGICESERLQAAEDDGVVCNYDRGLEGDGFVGDSFGEVDCEEDRVVLSAGRVEGSFQQQSSVVPRVVCQCFGVAV